MLVTDKEFNYPVYNMTVESRALNDWHSYPGSQIFDGDGRKGILFGISENPHNSFALGMA
jgi:hypothetical protein